MDTLSGMFYSLANLFVALFFAAFAFRILYRTVRKMVCKKHAGKVTVDLPRDERRQSR